MKAASALIQVLALSACLTVQALAGGEFQMAGVRRALHTMATAGSTSHFTPIVDTFAADDGAAG